MLHPDTELRIVNDLIGYGVFATRRIPRGTVTWVLDPLDQILTPERAGDLDPELANAVERYTWLDCRGRRILCWDFARYMNHSCEANSFSPGGFDFEIAVTDVRPGEQLTSDYGSLNLEQPLYCACGSPRCRRVVTADDFAELAPVWDQQIRKAFRRLLEVDQPLWSRVPSTDPILERMIRHPEKLPSILSHRWLPQESQVPVTAGKMTQ